MGARTTDCLHDLPTSLDDPLGPHLAWPVPPHRLLMHPTARYSLQATDWLDGYLARRMRLQSVLGSYLDPLGDKMLICSVALALAYKGLVPGWVAAVVVGRDVALVVGAGLQRWRALGWRTDVTAREFLGTQPPPAVSMAVGGRDCGSGAGGGGVEGDPPGRARDPGVPLMQPLLISKANTVMQLALLGGCMGRAWVEWPDPVSLHVLEVATAGTTVASCLAYAHKFMRKTVAV